VSGQEGCSKKWEGRKEVKLQPEAAHRAGTVLGRLRSHLSIQFHPLLAHTAHGIVLGPFEASRENKRAVKMVYVAEFATICSLDVTHLPSGC
jgi:hypothetical protein